MKRVLLVLVAVMPLLAACAASKCEVEPVVEQNHKLIVPPNFGQMPGAGK